MPRIDARSFDDFAVDQRGTKAVTDVPAAGEHGDELTASSSPTDRDDG